MFIIKFIFDRIFGTDEQQVSSASRILNELANGCVSNWYDVDDFLHRGFRNKTVSGVGELCGALARRFPGDISGMYSRSAVPYLRRLEVATLKGESQALEEMEAIKRELEIDWLK
jgi:hypothetical protein